MRLKVRFKRGKRKPPVSAPVSTGLGPSLSKASLPGPSDLAAMQPCNTILPFHHSKPVVCESYDDSMDSSRVCRIAICYISSTKLLHTL
jgi:hypothetical protein